MASSESQKPSFSSSSKPKLSFKYDIFLSSRGLVNRKILIYHLYRALMRKGFRTFIDNDNRGVASNPKLQETIRNSRMSMIVLSENYANSTACLVALQTILELCKKSDHVVLPVFYDVEPLVLKKQSKNLVFKKEEVTAEKVKGWSAALQEIASMAEMVLWKESDGSEAKFIQKIVRVLNHKLAHKHQSVDNHLVGFPKLDEQNLYAPDPRSREEEDSKRLQLQVHQYSEPTVGISGHGSTSGNVPEEGGSSMGEWVDQVGGLEDEEFLNEFTESLYEEPLEKILLGELEETPSDPIELEELNCDPLEVPPTISHHELDLSYRQINSLPLYVFRLVALKKLYLRSCELLMELPREIGELTNLEVLDLEGTEMLCLPKEIAKLVNLTCLKVSFYGYANQTVIPRTVLSNLSRLKELIIDVTPYGEWWDAEVEVIIDDLCSLQELTTLKLSLPTAELLKNLTIFRLLANFRFTVGRQEEHFISRLPRDVEEEFNNREKLDKGLKYINGSCIPNEITEVFKHANAFFLQRHWTAKSLSEFGHENMNEVKYCLVMECNEFRTIIDSEQFYQGKDEAIVLGSLEKLIIRYMKNMESVWKGPVGKGSLSNLKSLALHTCPNLTTLFTIDIFSNLLKLEELIVEDCPKIDSLISLKSSDSKSGIFLPNLKKISLLELPELLNISSGLCIAPNLERMVIFCCPKLEKLSNMDVSSTKLNVIKGEKEWWDALMWYESNLSTEHEDYLARLFIPLRWDGDLMAQLTKD